MKKLSILLIFLILGGTVSFPQVKAASGYIWASPDYFDGNLGNGPFTSYIRWKMCFC